jgi:hypothetical protein
MSIFDQILLAFGGDAVLLTVLAFLARSLIQNLLAKDLKKFESDLQSKAATEMERIRFDLKAKGDIELERVKSHLQQMATEHQVRFSNLHEERAKRMADLYSRIVRQSIDSELYVYQFGEVNRQEGFKELERTFSDLYFFFEASRIYLPEQTCQLLDNIIREIRKAVVAVYSFSGVNDFARADVLEQKSRTFTAALEACQQAIPEARKALESDFRKLLGVEK